MYAEMYASSMRFWLNKEYAMEKIKIVIDGKEVEAIRDQCVLDVAQENGIDIPALCYHPEVEASGGSCRVKALIQLRRIGTNRIMNFELDGAEPAFVDMPIWHTHNITNIGSEDLYTIFWISEFFDPDDPDTFFESV